MHPSNEAIQVLLAGRRYARELSVDSWQFAIEIGTTLDAGLTRNDLRWLLAKGLLQHGQENATPAGKLREFCKSNACFSTRSCFVLTEAGLDWVQRLSDAAALEYGAAPPPEAEALDSISSSPTSDGKRNGAASTRQRLKPRWDSHLREVRVGDLLVKSFKVPSANQETILLAFEELGWPKSMDDPLNPRAGVDPKRRLRDATGSLNRNQRNPLLKFHGNGTGKTILWDFVDNGVPVLELHETF